MSGGEVWVRKGFRHILFPHNVETGSNEALELDPQEGVVEYEGECFNETEHGEGKSYYWLQTGKRHVFNWLVYEGQWRNGKKSGLGRMTRLGLTKTYLDIDLDVYETVHVAPSWYEGEWEQDLPHGKGKLYINECLRYEGDFQNGYIQGDGSVYGGKGELRFQGTIKGMRVPPSKVLNVMDDDVNFISDDLFYSELNIPSWISSNLHKFDSLLILGEGIFYTASGRKWHQGEIYKI